MLHMNVFAVRHYLTEILPSQFDAAQHKINSILAELLPRQTEDHTPEGFFSKKFNDDDIGRLKDHLCKHSLDSSTGEDQMSYVDLVEIPNENLAGLYNECAARGDAPSIWFMSILVA